MEKPLWWQSGTLYQIYPRSFLDTNGDGVGDLRGIMQRLDYLQWLGVDAIWLSPIYPSPMADFGYDVSNYTDIDPLFGTLDDFDELLRRVHGAGMKLLMDFVPNHTSVQHAWFVESRSSRTNPKRDWYIWRDPRPDGGPPTNWLSNFGGSAWERDERTGQFYYHAFLRQQPDLNWRNPEVRGAMHDVLRFWLSRGVDGFRVDVIWHLVKDDQFRDNPRNPNYRPGQSPHAELLATYTEDRPEIYEIIAGIRGVFDEYDDRMMVGEIYLPVERLVTYYGQGGRGLQLPYNFQLISLPWRTDAIADAIRRYEAALPEHGWPNWVLGNHDNPRISSRVGSAQARVAAILLLTLRGTPTLYYGDEIGMADGPIASADVRDPFEKNVPGLGLGRDPHRTPMQWDASTKAGFTTAHPWLPVSPGFEARNVASLSADPQSILSFYRSLLVLRRATPALASGKYLPLPSTRQAFGFVREDDGGGRFAVVLNLSSEPCQFALDDPAGPGRIVLTTFLDRTDEAVGGPLGLRANEGVILRVDRVV